MTRPRTEAEQRRTIKFKPDVHIAVYFAAIKFDKVYYQDPKDNKVKKFIDNLNEISINKDINTMRNILKQFKFTKSENKWSQRQQSAKKYLSKQ